MPNKLTTAEFIKKSNSIHNNKYDYSLSKYVKGKIKVIIICPEHGEFNQWPSNHLMGSGCPICANKIRNHKNLLTTAEFIQKSNSIHNNKYDYSKVVYGSNNENFVIIICPEHGEFNQRPKHHLMNKGCPKCGQKRISKAAVENCYGWSFTNWIKKVEKNEKAKPKLYILKCYNDLESFIKIGITIHPIKIRYAGKRELPYDYDILLIKEDNIRNILNLEKITKKEFKHFKYVPEIEFNGMTECYNIKYNDKIIDFFK